MSMLQSRLFKGNRNLRLSASNLRPQFLKMTKDGKKVEFVPRDYQVQMVEIASKTNTIIFLPTGSGKTYIAVLLLKQMSEVLLRPEEDGRKFTVILVNTVALVQQHYETLKQTTPFKIGSYSGDLNVDSWSAEEWQLEIRKHQVFVMTSQIFLNNILHNFMTLSMVNLIIFDECHHAVSNHPMRQIMKSFENLHPDDQPRVLGLTATLLNSTVKPGRVLEEVEQLEITYQAKVATVDEQKQIVSFSTDPEEEVILYDVHSQSEVEIKVCEALENLWQVVKEIPFKRKNIESPQKFILEQNRADRTEMVIKESRDIKRLVIETAKQIGEQLGIYGGHRAIQSQMIKLECMKLRCDNSKLLNILMLISTKFAMVRKMLEDEMEGFSELERIMKFSTPKVLKLIQVLLKNLEEYGEEMCCIIFVQERFTAKSLYYILEGLKRCHPSFQKTKPNFVVGLSSNPMIVNREVLYNTKMYKKVIQKFANKEVDILIASSVVEEGIDIPNCKLVIKFDSPISYRSYVQSKGRARHESSKYVIMIDTNQAGNFHSAYNNFLHIEKILIQLLVGKTGNRSAPTKEDIEENLYNDEELESYYVDGPNSARVTMSSAISLLCRYCQTLFTDRYTEFNVIWYLNTIKLDDVDVYQSIIELPLTCPILEPIQGLIMPTKKLAKCSAALEGCKKLHAAGELNNNLVPRQRIECVEEDAGYLFPHLPIEKENGAGTNKKRRIHDVFIPPSVRGQIIPHVIVHLHLINFLPRFYQNESKLGDTSLYNAYTSNLHFGLLTAHPLPSICNFPLFVSQGEITVNLRYNFKTLMLSQEQIKDLREFHHLLFNDVLKVVERFVVLDNDIDANMTLVVPVRDFDVAYDVVRENKKVEIVEEPEELEKSLLVVSDDTHYLKIICPWYRMETYYLVIKVCEELSANSDFPSTDFDSFVSYYKDKYAITVKQPRLPLLLVKALSKRLNCLKPRGQHGRKRNKLDMYEEMEEHLVPELCIVFSFPSVLWIQATLLPSVLFKLMQFLRVENLRKRIATECNLGVAELEDWQEWKPQTVDEHTLKEVPELKTKNKDKRTMTEEDEISSLNQIDLAGPSMESIKKLNEEFANRLLEAQFPWKEEEEPSDIYKNLDEVTPLDITDFVKFISYKIYDEEGKNRIETMNNSKSYPALTFPREYKEKPIHMLDGRQNPLGVELVDIYQAFSTAKANDVVNLERFETLGDSFLKFAVSFYVLQKFLKYDEGKLTTLKGKIVSNKNLYYIAIKKGLHEYIKNSDFSPDSNGYLPGYKIPTALAKKIDSKVMPINNLFTIDIPSEDQSAGIYKDEFVEEPDLIDEPNDEGMCFFRGKQLLPDKTVADSVESVLGVYLQEYGCAGAQKILEWLEVIPPLDVRPTAMDISFVRPFTPEEVDFFIPHYKLLEERLGYSFKNRAYLLQALTHASFSPNRITNCYQRLEFLGDAVLDFLITCHIYESCGNLTPGELTDLRSALVNNITFAAFTVRCQFQKFLLTLNHKLMEMINHFVQFQEQRNFVINDEILILLEENDVYIAEHIDVPKVLGDLFEALAGAVFLDSGMCLKTVWRVFYKIMWKEIDTFSSNVPKNLVRLLFETKGAHPRFLKPKHNESGTTMVSLEFMLNGERKLVHGFGDSKYGAKKAAAKIALRLISITKSTDSQAS